MASYRGIDVSNWSGYINWREVRDAGIEVAICLLYTSKE